MLAMPKQEKMKIWDTSNKMLLNAKEETGMKKFNKIGYIAIGMVLALIISMVTPVFAASDVVKQLTAYFTSGGKPIIVYVNGDKLTKDSNGKAVTPFTANGVTYVPARAVAEALGKEVIWDGANATVKINDKADEKLNLPKVINDTNAKLTTTVDVKGNRKDSLEYKFILDKNAVGEWEFYDTYDDIVNQFNPNDTPHHMLTSLQSVSIYANGTMTRHHLDNGNKFNRDGLRWTKNYLVDLSYGDNVVPAYSINTISGKTFMVVEGKNGDYTRTGIIPYYDVFVKISDTPAPIAKTSASKITVTKDGNGVIHESMDYKFELDKDAVGQWEQINFVASPDDFDGKDITRQKYIEIGIHNFYEDGREVSYADKTRGTGETKWTKGYVWGGDDTISEYVIRQLNGKTFMFIQFKNGDYTVRGQKPNYFVYVKTSNTPDPEFAK